MEQGAEDEVIRQRELERFREAWKEELRLKKSSRPSQAGPEVPIPLSPDATQNPNSDARDDSPVRSIRSPSLSTSSDLTSNLARPSGSTSRAVDIYRSAVECEQQGRLDEALSLYRRSFKLDGNVDKAYHRLVSKDASLAAKGPTPDVPLASKESIGHTTSTRVSNLPHASQTSESLLQMIESFEPRPITFFPEDEQQPTPINALPDEIIVHILMDLAQRRDVTSIERFAAVNLKARIITADSSIWRSICGLTYVPPQIPTTRSVDEVASMYGCDYRQTFVYHPRVRLDGAYIAVCHYVRQGQSENAWISISHLITYHRYLRFYPNGEVISLLTNEEQPPAEVVHLLKPSLRMKGLQLGKWSLDDATRTVHIRDLRDPARNVSKYAFAMDLTLSSARRGRWNKLEIAVYESVNEVTGEAQEFSIRRERPFYFSKVKSYAPFF